MSLRGKCAVYKEKEGYKPFLITKELNKDGRRIIIHKHSGMSVGEYKRALNAHKKRWAEVMDEMEELGNCFVCEKPVFEWCESRDWCNSCKDQNIWRCEYCSEIQHNKKYKTDERGDAWCKECKRKYAEKKAKVMDEMALNAHKKRWAEVMDEMDDLAYQKAQQKIQNRRARRRLEELASKKSLN